MYLLIVVILSCILIRSCGQHLVAWNLVLHRQEGEAQMHHKHKLEAEELVCLLIQGWVQLEEQQQQQTSIASMDLEQMA